MKVLLLYTSHRQVKELKIAQFLYNKDPFLKTMDILFHCNNPDIDKYAVTEILNGFESPNIGTIFTSVNSGANTGVAEAINSVYDQLADYDYVIHLHPDVFILSSEKLQQALESNDPEQTDFIAWEINREYGMPPGKRRTLEYASDFFIFSPKERNNIFKDYVQYWTDNPHIQGQPGANSGCERFLGYQTQKYGVNVAYLDRGLYGGMRTELEPLGIWHCHNLRQIEQYLHRNF